MRSEEENTKNEAPFNKILSIFSIGFHLGVFFALFVVLMMLNC